MIKECLKSFLIALVLLPVLVFSQQDKYSRIKITIGQEQLSTIAKAGIPLDAGYYDVKNGVLITELSQNDISKLKAVNHPYEILVDDLSAWYKTRSQSEDIDQIMESASREASDYPVPANFNLGSCGGFSTIDECYAHLDNMATLFPDLITVKEPVSSLVTHEGRPVYYVKISDNPNESEDEPETLYTGMHHAREPIGMQHLLYYMYYLLENYATNEDVRALVNSTELYFIPIFNVDGYYRNIQTNPNGGGMWRKNRRINGSNTFGVDINRNYGYYWGIDNEGSSPYPSDETYRGPEAFSEPETQMIKEFCEDHNFKIALNYHSYSNLLLYAYGYTSNLTPDESVFAEYAKNMTVDNNYTYGAGNTTIYPSNGGSDDWMYGEQETKEKILAYTPECGGQNDGFWPSPSRIIPICQENMIQSILAAKYSGTFGIVVDKTPLIIPETDYHVTMNVTRLGQTASDYLISVEPLSSNIIAVGEPKIVSNLSILQTAADSVSITLDPSIKSGDSLMYSIILFDGTYTSRDTVVKYFGTPVVLFEDDLTTKDNWSGLWALTNVFPYSPPTSMTDSPSGNYSNNANKSTILIPSIPLNNASIAILSFVAKWNLEPAYDYVQLAVSTNGGTTWTALNGRYTKPGTEYQSFMLPVYDGASGWVEEEIDLSAFADQNIRLKFTLVSDQGVTKDGYYFDDVKITMIDRTVNTSNIANQSEQAYMSEGYPNPAREQVKYRYSFENNAIAGAGKRAAFVLSDLGGRKLYEQPINAEAGEITLNTGAYKAGTYVCSLVLDNTIVSVKRLVIIK